MKKEMLINVLQPEEIRIAILENSVLEELYVERTSLESYVGNIYKGRIVNIEPSIQAAFVDFGVGRNGFLHVSDVEPAYYRHLENGDDGRRSPRDRGRGSERDRGPRRSKRTYEDGPRRPEAGPGRDMEDDPRNRPAFANPEYPSDVSREPEDDAPHESGVMDWPGVEDVAMPPVMKQITPPEEISLVGESHPGFEASGMVDTEPAAHPNRGRSRESGESAELGSGHAEIGSTENASADPAAIPAEETEKEEAPRKGRRRGRGRGRGAPKDKSAEAALRDAGHAEPNVQPQPAPEKTQHSSEGEAPPPREWPRLMESAEHRTRAGDERQESIEPRPLISDEDLSFSMAAPTTPARDRGHVEPPRQEQEPIREIESDREREYPPRDSDTSWDKNEDAGREPAEADFGPADEPAPSADLNEPREPSFADERADQAPNEMPSEFEDEGQRNRRPPNRDFDRRDDRRGGGRRDNRRGNDRGGNDRGGNDRGGNDRGGNDRGGNDRGGPRRFQGRPLMTRPKPLIQDIFKRGQEVLVQVIKEGIGTKGPTLSTYIAIAGRYLVLMPGLQRIGVSRKIEDEESRRRLRQILHELEPPKGLGFIIRTAGIDRDKKELQGDLVYLSRLWEVVVRRVQKIKSPAEIYQESDMITRTLRDIFTSEIDTIWVDEKNAYEHAKEFLQIVMPRYANRIKFYDSTEPMFHRHGIENEIARIQQRHVPLPAGGSIVIDQTEALVAIDVNSGNFRADGNAEETAYQMNLQAAREIARQLRLRDLGGVIVNDFIDMRDEKHRRGVETALRDAVHRDRARTKILRISQFGIIEMTRQRIRPSLKRSVFQDCAHCRGTGQIKTCESMSIEVMRLVQLAAHRENVVRIEVRVQEEVANYLLNRKRKELAQVEEAGGKQISVRGKLAESPEFLEFVCYDNNANEVKFLPFDPPPPTRQHRGRR